MMGTTFDRRRTWQWIGGAVLLLGLACSAVLYWGADDTAMDASRYEVIDGVVYPLPLEDTKQYSRQMEVYGGKGLVLVDAVTRWFGSLWHGRRLAVVVAVCSVALALVFRYVANHPIALSLDADRPVDGRDEEKR